MGLVISTDDQSAQKDPIKFLREGSNNSTSPLELCMGVQEVILDAQATKTIESTHNIINFEVE